MAFKLNAGKVKTIWMPVTASTAIAEGALVTKSSGLLIAATSTTAENAVVGVLGKTIAATDADFATSARLVPVLVPMEPYTLWEFDVTSGLVIADCDNEVDLTDSVTVNRAGTTYKIVRPTQVISTTKGIGLVKFFGSF